MLTQERLKQLIHYCPTSGVFTRLTRQGKHFPGSQCGFVTYQGYINLQLDNKNYKAHRLAWFYIHGEWPNEIDHINRDRSDNTLANLRNSNRYENLHNVGLKSRNKTGVPGLYWSKIHNRWALRVVRYKKSYFLGFFDDVESAGVAREEFLRNFLQNTG